MPDKMDNYFFAIDICTIICQTYNLKSIGYNTMVKNVF